MLTAGNKIVVHILCMYFCARQFPSKFHVNLRANGKVIFSTVAIFGSFFLTLIYIAAGEIINSLNGVRVSSEFFHTCARTPISFLRLFRVRNVLKFMDTPLFPPNSQIGEPSVTPGLRRCDENCYTSRKHFESGIARVLLAHTRESI